MLIELGKIDFYSPCCWPGLNLKTVAYKPKLKLFLLTFSPKFIWTVRLQSNFIILFGPCDWNQNSYSIVGMICIPIIVFLALGSFMWSHFLLQHPTPIFFVFSCKIQDTQLSIAGSLYLILKLQIILPSIQICSRSHWVATPFPTTLHRFIILDMVPIL